MSVKVIIEQQPKPTLGAVKLIEVGARPWNRRHVWKNILVPLVSVA